MYPYEHEQKNNIGLGGTRKMKSSVLEKRKEIGSFLRTGIFKFD